MIWTAVSCAEKKYFDQFLGVLLIVLLAVFTIHQHLTRLDCTCLYDAWFVHWNCGFSHLKKKNGEYHPTIKVVQKFI